MICIDVVTVEYSTTDQFSCGRRARSSGCELDHKVIGIDVVVAAYSTKDQSSCGKRARSFGFEFDQNMICLHRCGGGGNWFRSDLVSLQSDHNMMMTAVCECCSEPLKKCYEAMGPPS